MEAKRKIPVIYLYVTIAAFLSGVIFLTQLCVNASYNPELEKLENKIEKIILPLPKPMPIPQPPATPTATPVLKPVPVPTKR